MMCLNFISLTDLTGLACELASLNIYIRISAAVGSASLLGVERVRLSPLSVVCRLAFQTIPAAFGTRVGTSSILSATQ